MEDMTGRSDYLIPELLIEDSWVMDSFFSTTDIKEPIFLVWDPSEGRARGIPLSWIIKESHDVSGGEPDRDISQYGGILSGGSPEMTESSYSGALSGGNPAIY
jgi:hypothetical protein